MGWAEIGDGCSLGPGVTICQDVVPFVKISANAWMAEMVRTEGKFLFGVLIAVLGALSGGCATPRADRPVEPCIGEAFCLRGLLDVFSLGLNELAERLRQEGFDANSMSGGSWRTLSRELQQSRLRGESRRPLVLIGHSYGADNAVRMARELGKWDIEVDFLVLLDATSPPTVPANVARCLHLYRPTVLGDLLPFAFAGNPVEPEEGNNRTEIINRIISESALGPGAARVDHFNIDASASVHDLVVDEVLQLYRARASERQELNARWKGSSNRASRSEE